MSRTGSGRLVTVTDPTGPPADQPAPDPVAGQLGPPTPEPGVAVSVATDRPHTETRVRIADALTRTGVAAWSILGMLALVWVVIWVLGRVHVLVAPVVLSVAVIYILNPVVNRLQRRGVPRPLGAALSLVGLVGLLVLVGWLVIPSVAEQAQGLVTDFPGLYRKSSGQIEDLIARIGLNVDLWSYEQLQDFLNDPANQDQWLSATLDRLGEFTSGLLEAVLVFVVAPVIALYVLIDLPRVRGETVALIPPVYRDETVYVSTEVGGVIGGFLRGQLLVAFIVGVLMSFGFWLIGLDFWLILGMLSGFLNIIPFVGPWVGGVLGFVVGTVTDSVTTGLWAGVVAIVVQQIDNHLISPTVMRATVRLHPAVVVLVLILGGALDGFIGVLLAVPVTAALKIITGHLWRTRVLGQSWEEATQALIERSPPPPPLRERLRRAAETVEDAIEGSDGEETADAADAVPADPPAES
jgi:predicted PurR-regulated permease PerM